MGGGGWTKSEKGGRQYREGLHKIGEIMTPLLTIGGFSQWMGEHGGA